MCVYQRDIKYLAAMSGSLGLFKMVFDYENKSLNESE